MNNHRISDRSRYETYFQCPRKRYWNYEYAGRGIESVAIKVDLLYGGGIHSGMDELIRTGDMEEALKHLKLALEPIEETTPDGYNTKDELYAMGTGHLVIFSLVVPF